MHISISVGIKVDLSLYPTELNQSNCLAYIFDLTN